VLKFWAAMLLALRNKFQFALHQYTREKMASTGDVAAKIANAKGADGENAIPFMGLVCCFESCYLTWPDTLGCAGKTSCLCYHTEFLSCKLPNPEKEEDKDLWFVCNRGNAVLSEPKNCCSVRNNNIYIGILHNLTIFFHVATFSMLLSRCPWLYSTN
jgi:hypothetical protein